MITPTIIEKLASIKEPLEKSKHFWTHDQIKIIYEIYNEYHQTKKAMTTCGSCVSNTTNEVRRIWKEYKENHG